MKAFPRFYSGIENLVVWARSEITGFAIPYIPFLHHSIIPSVNSAALG